MNSPQTLDPWIGRSLGDRQRYRLEHRLGSGGMGEVFLAMDTLLGQPVALKLLDTKLSPGDLRRRFEREVAVVTALRSQHIVRVNDSGVTVEGYPFYVMEYLQGQTLGQLLRREKPLPIERTISIITQVCAGLQLAHQGIILQQGGDVSSRHVKVIHRDLKPDNIFLLPTGLGELVKLLDFGIAKIRSDQAEYTHATSMFLGTYRYAAPEQFEIGQDLDERADIYSLGMILYEMLTGTDPFGSNEYQMTGATWGVAHLSKPAIPLRAQPGCEQLPRELDAVVMRCLQKIPENRFSSVAELNQALHAAVPNVSDRSLSLTEYAQEKNTEPPLSAPVPTHINPHSPTSNDPTLSATQNFTRSVGASTRQSRSSFTRSAFLRQPAFLLSGAGITTALAIGVYYLSQPLALSSLQASQPIAQESLSSTLAVQIEAPMLQSAVSSANSTLTGHLDTVWAVAIDPDGKTLISGGFDKTIKLWNLNTGKLLQTLTGHADAVRAIATSPDGKIMASGSGDKTIKIWNLQTGELLRTLPADPSTNTGHSGPVWSVAISPDSKTLASGSYDGTIKIWNLATGNLIRTLPDHYDSVWSVAISPDSKTLASGSYDGTIKIWNLATGAVLHTLSTHTDTVRSVAISPDGKTLASGSWDKTIRLWNLQTGDLIRTLSGHSDRVLAVAIDPSGQTLASSSIDRTIKLWNLQTGKLLRTLSGHSDWVTAIAFAPQPLGNSSLDPAATSKQTSPAAAKGKEIGETLVSGSKDKTVKVWR
jgi:WD40 repeat protein/tRNA A-37 threonylcarbamoyl transferase component Bud32